MSRRNSENAGRPKRKVGMGQWLSQVISWLTMREPSDQAFKQHKKDTYKNAGVALDDPRASAKLQYVPLRF